MRNYSSGVNQRNTKFTARNFVDNSPYPKSTKGGVFNVKTNQAETTDQTFTNQYSARVKLDKNQRKQSAINQVELDQSDLSRPRVYTPPPQNPTIKNKKGGKKSKLKKKADKSKAKGVSLGFIISGSSFHTTVMIFFSVLNTYAWGVVLLYFSLIGVLESTGIAGIIPIVDSAVESKVGTSLGFNAFSVIDPINLLFITQTILTALTLIMYIAIYLIYKSFGLEPLGGKGSGLKYGACALSFLGHIAPVAGALPWFLIWIQAVKLNPK